MAAADLQWIDVHDFSPGIRHVVSPDQPPGAADTNGTWNCIVVDAGVLSASPKRQQGFTLANPDTPGAIQNEQFRITGLHCQSPIANNGGAGGQETGPDASEAEVFLMYEWYKANIRYTNLDRLCRYVSPTRWENIWNNGGTAITYSAFIRPRNCFFATGRSNNADVNQPGYPVVAWTADDVARFWPDDASAITSATNATVALPHDPNPGAAPVGIVSHQGRVVVLPLWFYNHGLNTQTATNEQFIWSAVNDWRTIDPVFLGRGAVSVSYDDTGGGFQLFASMTSNELLFGKARGGAVMVRGDLNNFQVVNLPNFMSCGYSLNVGCKTPMGWAYPVDNGTVWLWSGGDRCQNIADYLEPNFWRPVNQIPANGPTGASGYGFASTTMCMWNKYIVTPNNWMFDTVKNSWWRMEDPTDSRYNYWHVATDATQRWLYATPSGWKDDTTPALYEYDFTRKNQTYYWLSHPLAGTADRHVTVRELILTTQVDPNFGLSSGSVTVTITSDQDPVGQSATFPVSGTSYSVHAHRSPSGFGVAGTNIRVALTSTSDSSGSAAPRIHGFRVGIAEQQRLPPHDHAGRMSIIPNSPASPCFLHVPHKDWSNDEERMNYQAIEEWVSLIKLDDIQLPLGFYDRYRLHIPYKEWDKDVRERSNYEAIEHWAEYWLKNLGSPITEGSIPSSQYDLFIPYKDWSDNDLELQNYLEIERWAYFYLRNCVHSGGG